LTRGRLSAMKWLVLPPSMETARPKRMRFALFSIAGRIVLHAGKLVLRIGREAEALASFIAARIRIAQIGVARIAAAAATPGALVLRRHAAPHDGQRERVPAGRFFSPPPSPSPIFSGQGTTIPEGEGGRGVSQRAKQPATDQRSAPPTP